MLWWGNPNYPALLGNKLGLDRAGKARKLRKKNGLKSLKLIFISDYHDVHRFELIR